MSTKGSTKNASSSFLPSQSKSFDVARPLERCEWSYLPRLVLQNYPMLQRLDLQKGLFSFDSLSEWYLSVGQLNPSRESFAEKTASCAFGDLAHTQPSCSLKCLSS